MENIIKYFLQQSVVFEMAGAEALKTEKRTLLPQISE